MKIFLNNRKLTFESLHLKNNLIYLETEPSLVPFTNNKVKYEDFIDFIKNSLENYISIENNDVFDVLSDYWNYFKITNNPIVRQNMAFKICYLVINYKELWNCYKLRNLIESYKSYKFDKFYIFINIILNLKIVETINNEKIYFDEENFTLLDFILDYNQ